MDITVDNVINKDENEDIAFEIPIEKIPTNILPKIISTWIQYKLELQAEESYQEDPDFFKSYIDSIDNILNITQQEINNRQSNNYHYNFIFIILIFIKLIFYNKLI